MTIAVAVRVHTGVWIETYLWKVESEIEDVRVHTGVWIETHRGSPSLSAHDGSRPYGRVD